MGVLGLGVRLARIKLQEHRLKTQPERNEKEIARLQKEDEQARLEMQTEVETNWAPKGFRSPEDYALFLTNQGKIEIAKQRYMKIRRDHLKLITKLYDKKELENLYYKKNKKSEKSEKSNSVSNNTLDVENATNVANYFARINWKGTQKEYEARIDEGVKKQDPKMLREWKEYFLASRQDTKILEQAKALDKKQARIQYAKLGINIPQVNDFMNVAMALPKDASGKPKQKKNHVNLKTGAILGLGSLAGIADAVAITLKLKSKEASNHFVNPDTLQEILNSAEYQEQVADFKSQAEEQITEMQSLTEQQVASLNEQISDIVSSAPNATTILNLQTEIADSQSQIDAMDAYYDQLKQEQATNVDDLFASVGWTGSQEDYVNYASNLSSAEGWPTQISAYNEARNMDEHIISEIDSYKAGEDYLGLSHTVYFGNKHLIQEYESLDNNTHGQINSLQEQIDDLYANVDTQRTDIWDDYQNNVDDLTDQYLNQAGENTDSNNIFDNVIDLMSTDPIVMGLTAAASVAVIAAALYKHKHKKDKDHDFPETPPVEPTIASTETNLVKQTIQDKKETPVKQKDLNL